MHFFTNFCAELHKKGVKTLFPCRPLCAIIHSNNWISEPARLKRESSMAAGRQGLAGNGPASRIGKGIDYRCSASVACPFFMPLTGLQKKEVSHTKES